ncbi:MAG: 50S ribosomal protein L21 [Patescibacteria group bacterium]|nr:50S ribosomal protein L21 [Patescibacteria group bacterium]MDD5121079.1 50S ribosomal protein L21 [Patescibacteria group bacterium]MDD5221991.1 50S ribosomal protein L21 [Patescibacteria group bacterium]MDD5396002.1 50S ribosomal protein L21 [Patescibacteria group bacterium]
MEETYELRSKFFNNFGMNFAIIKTGGKQYLVKVGQTLFFEKLAGAKDKNYSFDQVLLVGDEKGEVVKIGKPYLSGASVDAEILGQIKGPKVHVMKFKSKVRYHRNVGHRQQLTKAKITKITA